MTETAHTHAHTQILQVMTFCPCNKRNISLSLCVSQATRNHIIGTPQDCNLKPFCDKGKKCLLDALKIQIPKRGRPRK